MKKLNLQGKFRDPKSKEIYTVLGACELYGPNERCMTLKGIIDNHGRKFDTSNSTNYENERLIALAFDTLAGMI